MPAIAENSYTLITEPAAVAATLADLQARGESLLLRGMADGRSHHVLLTTIEDDPGRLIWQRVDAGHGTPVAVGDMLQLESRRRSGHLVSSAMYCDGVSHDARAGSLELRTRLPLRLTLRHARQDWRARVVPGEMRVEARLSRPEAPPVHGTLVDLSVGGCRLVLARDAAAVEPDDWVNLRLTFPNGEQALFGARVGDVAIHTGARREAGLIFVDLSDEQTRRLWFLTCEIDRESERLQSVRDELRPLAPSTLFQPPV
ncbi:PilZ domain-containing protein [Salinisphaera hydrothermalis]|uniref:Metal dependent phosphohydrolase n=1 Tax=Salinisphaera hydrothermalis (strain C41B8) TaxID=1304275 RepID=A0A084IKF3_SALHC|nr:PilZ domain-containing protein [Salinisphaera hydrothermalis]KEZ77187.1 metal dependent phosphohydrolase [Salinisphaera hydrothermalis C41B8]